MRDKVNTKSTDDEVIAALNAEVDAAIDNAETVVRTRVDKFGVAQPNIRAVSWWRCLVHRRTRIVS